MTSIILSAMTRLLLPLMVMFSVFLLLRGHNSPGGGFAGGLVAAAAVVQYAIAYDAAAARRLLRLDPRTVAGAGLLLAAASAICSLLVGEPLMTSHWVTVHAGAFGELHLGTPLLFDAGVYLVVVGVTLTIVLSLAEE